MKDTSLFTKEESSPFSSRKKKLDPPVHNLTKDLNASDSDKRLKIVEKILYDINSKIDVLMMNLANLNKSLLPEQAVINRPPNLPPLPLNDIKRLEEFEKFISKDVNLSAACYYFKTLVLENEEKTAVSKLMTKLMTNSLAIHFNFDGQNPQNTLKMKRSFKQLKLWELV